MAIKKEALDNFFEEELSPSKKPVYSSYRVFDELPLVENDNTEVSNKKIISAGKQSHNISRNKPITQNITISKQLANKPTEKPITIGEQLENKAITEYITNGTPKRCSNNSLACLSGLPRKIILAKQGKPKKNILLSVSMFVFPVLLSECSRFHKSRFCILKGDKKSAKICHQIGLVLSINFI